MANESGKSPVEFSNTFFFTTAALVFAVITQTLVGFALAHVGFRLDKEIAARDEKGRRDFAIGLSMFLCAINAIIFAITIFVWPESLMYVALLNSIWITWAAIFWLIVMAVVITFSIAFVNVMRDTAGNEDVEVLPEYEAVAMGDIERAQQRQDVDDEIETASGSHRDAGDGIDDKADL